MPTAREAMSNRPLSAWELREIIRQDFERLLDAEGLLSSQMGFGRVAYRLRLTLEIDRVQQPSSTFLDSRYAGTNVVERQPELASQEAFPLKEPSSEVAVVAKEVRRNIKSPNRERLRTGQPVSVDVKRQDGATVTEKVPYPKDPELEPGDVDIADVSAEGASEAGVAVAPARRQPTPEEADAAINAPAEKREFWSGAKQMEAERDPNAPWPTTEP